MLRYPPAFIVMYDDLHWPGGSLCTRFMDIFMGSTINHFMLYLYTCTQKLKPVRMMRISTLFHGSIHMTHIVVCAHREMSRSLKCLTVSKEVKVCFNMYMMYMIMMIPVTDSPIIQFFFKVIMVELISSLTFWNMDHLDHVNQVNMVFVLFWASHITHIWLTVTLVTCFHFAQGIDCGIVLRCNE